MKKSELLLSASGRRDLPAASFAVCENGHLGYLSGHMATVAEVVNAYQGYRATRSVADAANATIAQFGITPSLLVDAFNAGLLDMRRSEAEAAIIHGQRNELLTHFGS